MSCGSNPFGGSILSGDGRPHGLSVVPDPMDETSGPVPGPDSGPAGPVLDETSGPASGPGPVLSGPEDRAVRTGPDAGSELVLADALPGQNLSPAERFLVFLKLSGKRAAAKLRQKGALRDMVRHWDSTPPDSQAAHRAYITSDASRGWIPEGYAEYKLIRFLRATQVTYHRTLGHAGVAFGNNVAKTFARGRRLAAVIACLTLAVILIAAFA